MQGFMKSTLACGNADVSQGHVGIHDLALLTVLGSTWYLRMLGTSVVGLPVALAHVDLAVTPSGTREYGDRPRFWS